MMARTMSRQKTRQRRKRSRCARQAWCDVLENSEKGNSMKVKGFWEAVINYFEMETGSTRGYDSILSKWKNRVRPRIEYKGAKKSKTSETTSGSASGGFKLNDEADEYEEAREHRPLGCDDAKAKKKSTTSSREGLVV
ncbi:hypothetical protein Tco_1323520, partial [Tanacetum coccineum]